MRCAAALEAKERAAVEAEERRKKELAAKRADREKKRALAPSCLRRGSASSASGSKRYNSHEGAGGD